MASVDNCRLIQLQNCDTKFLRCIVNRIQTIILKLLPPSQSGIKGKIPIFLQLMNLRDVLLHAQGGDVLLTMLLKTDLRRAHGRVSHTFVLSVLVVMKFPSRFIN